MAVRQRAMQAQEKQERYDAILDAAERLLTAGPERLASMSDVAQEAGLAKGTVYLYFASKEELYLALHERNVDAFFRGVFAAVEGAAPATVDTLLALTRRHMIAPPLLLPLAARCFGAMAHDLPTHAAQAFKERMSARLARAGAGLERHFDDLAPGDGAALLRHSFALIIGLWQMASAPGRSKQAEAASAGAADISYPHDVERALAALWAGTVRTRRVQATRP